MGSDLLFNPKISGFNYKENVAYIEDCMAMLKPMTIPLRLICLLSHCNDGLSFSDFQKLKTQFVQAYGFHHLVTWSNLLKSGIIRVKGGINQSSSFSNLKPDAAANKIGLGIVMNLISLKYLVLTLLVLGGPMCSHLFKRLFLHEKRGLEV